VVLLKMIKKIIKYILTFFREVYIYESKRNKKKVIYNNFLLKQYKSGYSIKNHIVKKYLTKSNRFGRFKNDQILFVLFFQKKAVCFGWMNLKPSWEITEVNKIIIKKNTLILYDFFTDLNFRNRGYYTKILNLIKNIKTKKKFLIYCLKNNESSKRGISKAKFVLVDKIKGLNLC
tara:strand:+ start:224 stop:748 length:525 start_codon:yes stop_codon:yes gene_type:complete